MIVRVPFLAATIGLFATAALGCGFHTYVPQPTMVDRLMNSDHIVLARPTQDDPFRFTAMIALEGPLEAVELPHLVDSTTRRQFRADPHAHVLFARDGAYGPWQRVAYVDAAMKDVLDHVVSHLSVWELGNDIGRFTYFGGLINSADPKVRRLALRELDQANYGVLRGLELDPDPTALASRMSLMTEAGLAPIRILLMGLSDGPEVAGFLRAGVERNIGGTNVLLGAYSTAWIENGGATAANTLAASYLADASLPIESREMVVEALAIHAEAGDMDVRTIARGAVASAVLADPNLAPAVARQFGKRNDWSLGAPVAAALRVATPKSLGDILVVNQYVALADVAGLPNAN